MTKHDNSDSCGKWSCARAPPMEQSLHNEMIPTFYLMNLVYEFTNIIKMAKANKLDLKIPEGLSVPNLERFLDETIDFTDPAYNGGNGLSFFEIDTIVKLNKDELIRAFGWLSDYLQNVVQRIRKDLEGCSDENGNKIDGESGLKQVFLTHHRSINRRVACVYTIVKDTIQKRIIVSFRGSQGFLISTRDWQTNFNALPIKMKTPKKVKDKMKGILKERLLVHRGFYNYLFDNEYLSDQGRKERYDEIIGDIRGAINGAEGYSIYVTGHSMGGALATLFSMKLAGSGKRKDDIPRPITCICWASPRSGTQGYRTACQHLEREGLLRHLRVNVAEDLVPAIPSWSLFRLRMMKHTGINLRMTSSGCCEKKFGYRMEHSSRANFGTAFRNSIFTCNKHIVAHLRPSHIQRLEGIEDQLKEMKLDDLYKDEKVVSKDFKDGIIGS